MGTDIHIVCQVNVAKEPGFTRWETQDAKIARYRNYDTFAVLADVRNGAGFAGLDTGEGWHVLFPPRGLPVDFVPKVTWDEEDDLGDHSYSWLTLLELYAIQAYYKNIEYEIHGMLSPEQYKALQEGTKPSHWCGLSSDKSYVKAKWKEPATDLLGLLRDMIADLEKVAQDSGATPDKIRIVFGFDS